MSKNWFEILGYEGLYQINKKGDIKAIPKTVGFGQGYKTKKLILNQYKSKEGYLRVRLYKKNKCKNYSVHRLVALQFLENPKNKPQVNHKNGVKTDNRLENLEWNTRSENMKHSFNMGLSKAKKGAESPNSILTEKDVVEIKTIGNSMTQKEIGKIYGVDRRQIGRILNNKRWKHVK
jgi:hypothetical protein